MQSLACVLVGDHTVGKTSLVISYTSNAFPVVIPTVIDNCTVDIVADEEPIRLELRDPAGREDYESLRLLSYPQASVVLICFSLISPTSLYNALRKWYLEVRENCPNTPIVLVGTKLDLREQLHSSQELKGIPFPSISHSEGIDMMRRMKSAKYVECSAITREGLDEVFQEAVKAGLRALKRRERQKGKCCFL